MDTKGLKLFLFHIPYMTKELKKKYVKGVTVKGEPQLPFCIADVLLDSLGTPQCQQIFKN